MAAALVRRSLATITVAGLAIAGSPLLGSASAATAPALKSTYPAAGAYIVNGGETLSATYDQQISSKSTFVVRNSAGNSIPGSVKLSSSSQFGGTTDTIDFTPSSTLTAGQYTASVHVDGVDSSGNDNSASATTTNFVFGVDGRAPQNASGPSTINNVNESAVPFTGTAAPGLTVEVDISSTQDPSGSALAKGTSTVPACSSAPNCPWTVKVDAHTLADGTTYQWSAFTTDAGGKSSPGTGPTPIIKDTTAPMAPTNVSASIDSSFQTVQVSAKNGDSSAVAGYNISIADPEGHAVSDNGVAPDGNGDLPATNVGVGSLDDGVLTVSVFAVDEAGNVSSAAHPSPEPEKKAGIALDFAGSTLTTPSATLAFPDAETHLVQSPTSIQIHLTNAVDPSFTDNGTPPGTTYNSEVCIADNTGNCVVLASTPTLSSDARTMTVPISGQLADSGSPYTISVRAFDLNECPDRNPVGSWTCYTLSGPQTDVGKATALVPVTDASGQPFKFSLDDTAPSVAFTSFSPSLVTASTVHSVSITGTASNDTTSVQLVIKSSAGGNPMVSQVAVTPDSSASTVNWSASPLDLSTVPDGTLTITATAVDAAGNRTATPAVLSPSPLLEAHPSTLSDFTNHRVVTYGQWIHLHGRLTAENGAGIGGATLRVRPRFDNRRFGPGFTVTTSGRGYWSRWLRPVHNATYWVFYAGTVTSPLHGAVTTHTARTYVRVRVRFLSPSYGALVSSPVRIRGVVSPNKHGRYIYLYRHTKTRNFFLGRVRLGKSSRWSIKVNLPHGTSYVYALFRRSFGNLAGRTGYRKLRH